MLGKLLKYEYKATGRVLLPIYLMMIMFAFVSAAMFKTSFEIATTIALLIFIGICVASIVITIIITVQRFQKNLLTDEGYLMFTLPVTQTSLIFSKLIVAVTWGIVGSLIGLISGSIFAFINVPFQDISQFFTELWRLLATIGGREISYIILSLVGTILNYTTFVLIIYLSLSFGQLPIAGKHRNAMTLLGFFGIYVVYCIFAAVLGNLVDNVFTMSMLGLFASAVTMEALIAAALFLGINLILKKHLNLE